MKMEWILTAVLVVALTGSVNAQKAHAKARHERARIQGVRSGELTRPEAYRLHREQRHIRKHMHHARKDNGRIDARERTRIRHEQRKHSRHIYMAKHNGRKRF